MSLHHRSTSLVSNRRNSGGYLSTIPRSDTKEMIDDINVTLKRSTHSCLEYGRGGHGATPKYVHRLQVSLVDRARKARHSSLMLQILIQ